MATNEKRLRTRPLQHGFAWVIGYLAMAVSVLLAVRFAYASADTTIDAWIRAGAAGVAAVVGCHGPAWILRSVRLREWSVALFAALGFVICLAVTLAGGIGTIAAGSDKTLAMRKNVSSTYADRRKELERLRENRAALPTRRPAGTIESDMTAARVDRRWMTSSSCTDATATASRTFCADYARLQGELAAAREAFVLDEKIGELTGKLEMAPAMRAANPQAEVIARLVHVSAEDAEAWYALLFVLAVEAAAMSVLLIAESITYHRPIGHVESVMLEREKRFVPVVQRSVPEIVVESGRVIDWLRDRAIPANGTTVTNLEVLHADYEVWCMQKELSANSADAFRDEFDNVRDSRARWQYQKAGQPILRDCTRGYESSQAAGVCAWSEVKWGVAVRHSSFFARGVVKRFSERTTRILERQLTHIGRGVHANYRRGASRILQCPRRFKRAIERWRWCLCSGLDCR
jgi:hypothetical protein